MDSKYNYIVVCLDNEMYDYAYAQINELSYAHFDNHFVHKTDRRDCWNNERIDYYYQCWMHMKEKREQICFVLFADCLRLEEDGFSEMLRNRFPNCKIVFFFQDLISKDARKLRYIKERRSSDDLIFTFDTDEAKKYDLLFHNIPYSYPKDTGLNEIKYDLSFVGQAKDRLNQIYKYAIELNQQKVNSMFFLVGVMNEQRRFDLPNIEYVDWMPYGRYLQIVKSSKCILEVIQGGGSGNTIRVPESIAYNKLLLSDNFNLFSNSLYNEKYMRVFQELSDIDINAFLQTTPQYNNPIEITPAKLLWDIGKELDK